MQVSDDIYLGPVFLPSPRDPNAPSSPQNGVGPAGRTYVFDIVPVTLGTALLATAQAATGGSVVLTAGAGVTTRLAGDGTIRYVLDTPRNVTLTAAGANTQVATVVGYDQYGQRMTELFAAPASNTVSGKKAFKEIVSITFAATPGSNVSAGIGDVFGFPVAIVDPVYLASLKWNATLADNAATVVVADGNPASPSTGDVRGTVAPAGGASNGVRRLVAVIALSGIQAGPQATRLGLAGVNQA